MVHPGSAAAAARWRLEARDPLAIGLRQAAAPAGSGGKPAAARAAQDPPAPVVPPEGKNHGFE